MRFIIGNLYDFNAEQHETEYELMLPQDRLFLHYLYEYAHKVGDLDLLPALFYASFYPCSPLLFR